jgi:hypothetical protein
MTIDRRIAREHTMADEQRPASGAEAPPGQPARRRPGATIDLTATEVTSEAAAANADADSRTDAEDPGHEPSPEEPAADARAASSGSAPPGRLRSGIPWTVLGAAALGVVLTVVVAAIAGLSPGRDDAVVALDTRLARLEQQLRDLADRPAVGTLDATPIDDSSLKTLADRLARLEVAAATARPTGDPALANRVNAMAAELKTLSDTVAALGRRADANAAALAAAAQQATPAGPPQVERGEIEALGNRVAAVERSAKTIESELSKRPGEAADRSLRLAVVADALRAAVERGEPFAAQLAAAKALAADPKALAPLEPFAAAGVPSAAALARELAGLTPALLQAAGSAPRDGSFLEKLQANAEKIVRIRPLDDVPGDDPAAIITRIDVRAARSDVAGALAELARLPATARAPAASWIAKAEARMAAIEASRALAADALAALGK